MAKQRITFIIIAGFFLFVCVAVNYAEDMTITTYYPSPNGTYDALNVKRLSVGDTNGDGSINASDVSASSGYLLVADKIGVGTRSPSSGLAFGGRSLIIFNKDTGSETTGNIIGGMGFIGYGVSHGQFDYRAGTGFEMLNVSNDGPSISHAATTFAPLYLSSLYATSTIGNRSTNIGQQMEIGSSALTTLRFDSDAYRVFAGGTSGSGELVRITEGGNVGIGTTNPGEINSNAKLALNSSGHTYFTINAPLAYQSSISFGEQTNGQDIVIYRPEGTRDLSIYTATNGNSVRVLQNGNVGIGTSNPYYKLDVQGGGFRVGDVFDVSIGCADFKIGYSGRRGTPGRALVDLGNALSLNHGADWPYTYIYGTVSYPSSQELKKDIKYLTNKDYEYLLDQVRAYDISRYHYKKESQNSSYHLGLIAEHSPKTVVTDDGKAIKAMDYTSLIFGGLKALTLQVDKMANYGMSDIKLKKDIVSLGGVIEKLKKIRGVKFHWINKDAGTRPEIGVIAQEVEREFPELVWTDPKSGYKFVKYEKLAPVLIEAIKEQQKQIEELRSEIKKLTR